ncbi:MAG TPA: 30S ribosomal protein S28e [archaeon]|nr:30S ribosomal protein S28e [archaeon]
MAEGIPARVIQVLGALGVRGVSRVRCKIEDGKQSERTLIRNVIGPIRKGDVILLKDTEMEFGERLGGR